MLIVASAARGGYLLSRDRQLVTMTLPNTPWVEAMRWLEAGPPSWYVLADPGHAWKYGTSVRVAGERDVYLEEVKDAALALYSPEIAARVRERIQDAQNFDAMTAGRAKALATKYDLTYLVIDRDIDLPLAYRNTRFRVYALKNE